MSEHDPDPLNTAMIQSTFIRACVLTLLLMSGLAAAPFDDMVPARPACDPAKQSCAPGAGPAKCQAMECFSTLEAQAKFEKENNCKFPPCSDAITEVPVEVLRQVFTSPSISLERLTTIAEELTAALKNKAISGLIDTKRKLAHFLAQVKQEVGPSMRLEENLSYTPKRLKKKFSYFAKHPTEADLYGRTKDHPADQEAIADRAYANRNGNGNVASGDGWRYRGRGMIQLTGKSNYKSFTTAHNKIWTDDVKDFVKNPDLVVQEIYAVRSALLFWKTHNLANIANKGVSYDESSKITAVINKNTDTYKERFKNLEEIMKLEFFKECAKK